MGSSAASSTTEANSSFYWHKEERLNQVIFGGGGGGGWRSKNAKSGFLGVGGRVSTWLGVELRKASPAIFPHLLLFADWNLNGND